MTSEKNIEEIRKSVADIGEAVKNLTSGGTTFEHTVRYLLEDYDAMFNRFCPFEVDEMVEIAVDIDFKKAYGWQGGEHYLQKGCKARVVSRAFSNGHFRFETIPENQTHKLFGTDVEEFVENPAIYCFWQDSLRKCVEPDKIKFDKKFMEAYEETGFGD